ncbi:MAG: AAA family ATPase [Halobacteriales archaeon]|nr:AAA family ATPase [Halobacteriales archaeon]
MSDTDQNTATVEATVRAAPAGDAGRGIARLSDGIRRRLGVLSGDTIVIEGDRAIVVTAWPGGDGEDGTVTLARELRDNAGVGVGEQVRIRSEPIADARTVTVRLSTQPPANDPTSERIRQALRDRPITTGTQFEVRSLEGTARIVDTRPDGTVRITDTTTIHVGVADPSSTDAVTSGSEESTDRLTYADIGGLEDELKLVREMIELPLSEPALFERLGIDPPKGVLLYGPPGTGKTLIAEAVAGAVDATFFHISGPEILSKYKGESEERLREIFDQAREDAPAIVFFDEIDALAGRREDGGDMESRVVAQLLSLLDGLDARGDVIAIGATNRVDAIDPALRRPGRFDREIEIGVPDEAGRREILSIHTRGVPLGDGVELDRLAERTPGFVGADLRALVTEAAMTALRRARKNDRDTGDLIVTRQDVESALAAVEPSAMREFVAETPETGFDDIGGLSEVKTTLQETVDWPLSYPNLFEATATDPPTGILLYGPPGTGKTMLARAVAHESDVNVIHVAGPELLDKYVGESEKAVREVFERARQAAPAIIFFDELDAIATRRGGGDNDVTERVVSQLLTELDGAADNPNLIVLAATNRRDDIDPALLRPGRFETHLEVPDPDRAARRAILDVHTREKPLADDVDLDSLADSLEGASGADIAAIVREASMRAIREAVADRGVATAHAEADTIEIDAEHFETAHEQFDRSRR